jgi:phosphatidylglycerophosphate synthase
MRLVTTSTTPQLTALRVSVGQAGGVGLAGTLGVAAIAGSVTDIGGQYVLTSGGLFAAIMAAVAVGIAGQHPFARFGPANYVTMSRAAVVALTAALISQPATTPVLWFVVVVTAAAAILDGFDGWFARRSGMASAFGARFDVEIDAALILVLSILVWQYGKAGPWVLLSGLLRYLFVGAGLLVPWLRRPLTATRRAKTIAITQLVVLICAVGPIIPVALSRASAAIALALLAWSFAIDVLRLSRQSSA